MSNSTEPLSFDQILDQMNSDGHFNASVLASQDGLAVASAPTPSPYDADTVAAMVALVKDFIVQTQTRLGMADVDEVSMVVGDKSRLVCRYFNTSDKQPLVLAVLTPPNATYRRLTTHAVRKIQTAWSGSSM